MPSYENNVYYSPEKNGLTQIFECDLGEFYEFDTFVVWVDEDGKTLWAYDSGCSCPTPFEDFDGVGDLNDSDPIVAFDEWGDRTYGPKPTDMDKANLVAALAKVAAK